MITKLHRFAALAAAVAAVAAPAAARADTKATAAVPGKVRFEVTALQGDVEIVKGKDKTVEVTVDGRVSNITIEVSGDHVELEFDGMEFLRQGNVRVALPAGSTVEVEAINGAVTVTGLGGDVSIEAVQGDVTVTGAEDVEIEAVSGDVTATGITGRLDVETVSGGARLETTGGRVEVETVSGNIQIHGPCAKGCRIDAESLSGVVELHLTKSSSFELDFETFSGSLDDQLGAEVSGGGIRGKEYRGRYGKGGGRIDVSTYSGTLRLMKPGKK